jgi:ATP-binding cassette subfamily B protein
MNKPHKTGWARLWELAFRKRTLIIASCVFSAAGAAASFIPFIAVYYIIREVAVSYADARVLNTAALMRFGWLAVGGAAGAILLNFIALMCSHLAAFSTLYHVKLEFLRHIALLPLGFHTGSSTGKLRKIADENIEKLEGFIAHQLPDLVASIAMPVGTLVILFVFDWRLGLASLVPIALAYGVQMSAFGNKNARVFIDKYQNSLEEMNNAAVEYVRGISVVKAFHQTVYSFRTFYKTIKAYGGFCLNYTMSFELFMELFLVIISHAYLFLVPAIIFLSGGALSGVGGYSSFALASVFYLIFSVTLPATFTKLLYVSQNGLMILKGIERMDEVMDEPPLPISPAPRQAADYEVSFEHVTFTYNSEGEAVALQDVSFTARRGEVTALAGPSGGGKSTIAHLIPRFYDVAGGAVKIGGVDVRDMTDDYLMSIVAFVFQDVFLFKRSIMDNLLVGNKNATRDEAIAAAKSAQCHGFIEALPRGYDTVIGERNVHLSGGERQRLVIARAILKDAPIIVLDEATAFADPENERNIQKAFESLMNNKTVIIIAHRLSTVRGADKIVVIDEGRVVEEGVHDDLARAGGRYSRLWERYAATLDWKLARRA